MDAADWLSTGAALAMGVEIGVKIELLTVFAGGSRIPLLVRYAFSMLSALVCLLVARVLMATCGLVVTAVGLWLVEHLLIGMFAWYFTPVVRTADFWRELAEVRLPRWIEAAQALAEKLRDPAQRNATWTRLRRKASICWYRAIKRLKQLQNES